MGNSFPRTARTDPARLADQLEAVGRDGDRQAFAALFEVFAPRIRAYLMRLGTDGARADELVQETMVTVWRRAAMFDRRQASVATWLFTIARNKRIDALRRERRPEYDPNDPTLVPTPAPLPDESVDASKRQDRIRLAVAALPPEQAALLRAAFLDGQSHREIAEATGLPLGTVKSRLRLALAHLRRSLRDLQDDH